MSWFRSVFSCRRGVFSTNRLRPRSKFHLLIIVGLAAAWLMTAPISHAQDNICERSDTRQIAYGDSVTGSIDDSTPFNTFCFEGSAGDEITITMSATSGNLDTFIALSDPLLETSYGENDDIEGSGTRNSELSVTLEDDGTYLIIATRYEFSDGQTSGDYELTLTAANAQQSQEEENNFCQRSSTPTIHYGETYEGEITDETTAQAVCFEGRAGEEITITMVTTGGNLDPLLALTDPFVQITYAENDDAEGGGTRNSEIVYTLEADGTYLIFASRYQIQQGQTTGTFELTLTSSNASTQNTECSTLGGMLGGDCEESSSTIPLGDNTSSAGLTCAEYPLNLLSAYQWGIPGRDNADPLVTYNIGCSGLMSYSVLDTEGTTLPYQITNSGEFSFEVAGVTYTTVSVDDSLWVVELSTGETYTWERLDEGECDSPELAGLIGGAWRTGSDLLDFGCNDVVLVTLEGETFVGSYAIQGTTIIIDFTMESGAVRLSLEVSELIPGESMQATINGDATSFTNILAD